MSQTNEPYTSDDSGARKAGKATAKKAGTHVAKKAGKKIVQKAAAGVAVKSGGAAAFSIGWPAVIAIVIAWIILIVLAFTFIILVATSGNETASRDNVTWGEGISEIGENEIPSEFIPVYQEAEKKYGVPWNLLAAHHRVETVFSTIEPMISPVGATGHMQFMPCTWVGWNHPSCSGLGEGNISEAELTDPKAIEKYGGYGVDGDGDGKADPNNLKDSVFAAANYLASNGASEGNIREAVFAYNHADWYVEEVMGFADSYVDGYVAIEEGSKGKSGVEVVDVGREWIGNSQYVFGGGRNQSDISRGRFDCSSFVHWVFDQAGIDVGPLGSTSTDTLKHLGKPIAKRDMKPGDLVFFDTYKQDGHVGIYIGDGEFIGAQTNKGVSIEDMTQGYWEEKFNGRVKRL
ncbi:secreted cell wall DL-endopeptidase [Rossellomorea marisflavi]|uniref:Secreted cell wall DL-endopeptidase n=1 Tax=Rossellomorea marisflavi TaxID=189381 RepID=A0A5D4RD86_9BACI|nr:bifunctional lytic transglycosylase/C40 family peptidase [Rossellomorea marisflavi]TYS48251.1 secreted cell wall DL-endopeptidase [Rossellomorea marisflavi]